MYQMRTWSLVTEYTPQDKKWIRCLLILTGIVTFTQALFEFMTTEGTSRLRINLLESRGNVWHQARSVWLIRAESHYICIPENMHFLCLLVLYSGSRKKNYPMKELDFAGLDKHAIGDPKFQKHLGFSFFCLIFLIVDLQHQGEMIGLVENFSSRFNSHTLHVGVNNSYIPNRIWRV